MEARGLVVCMRFCGTLQESASDLCRRLEERICLSHATFEIQEITPAGFSLVLFGMHMGLVAGSKDAETVVSEFISKASDLEINIEVAHRS